MFEPHAPQQRQAALPQFNLPPQQPPQRPSPFHDLSHYSLASSHSTQLQALYDPPASFSSSSADANIVSLPSSQSSVDSSVSSSSSPPQLPASMAFNAGEPRIFAVPRFPLHPNLPQHVHQATQSFSFINSSSTSSSSSPPAAAAAPSFPGTTIHSPRQLQVVVAHAEDEIVLTGSKCVHASSSSSLPSEKRRRGRPRKQPVPIPFPSSTSAPPASTHPHIKSEPRSCTPLTLSAEPKPFLLPPPPPPPPLAPAPAASIAALRRPKKKKLKEDAAWIDKRKTKKRRHPPQPSNDASRLRVQRQRQLAREKLAQLPEPKRELLKSLWTAANAPDSNLGVAVIGPSPQKLRLSSAVAVLQALGVDNNSSFLDIGSGHGLVTLTAVVFFDAQRATGVEVEQNKSAWSVAAKNKLDVDRRDSVAFVNLDICLWKDLQGHSHVYAFDFDFPPPVMRHIGRALRCTPQWTSFASCSNVKDWEILWQEDENQSDDMAEWWSRNVCLVDQVSVTLCGSHEQHTLFIYRRINPASIVAFPASQAHKFGPFVAFKEETTIHAPCI